MLVVVVQCRHAAVWRGAVNFARRAGGVLVQARKRGRLRSGFYGGGAAQQTRRWGGVKA
jgi:hypothetical protein